MFTHKITYEDFNGDSVTETLNFHLSQTEIVNLNVNHEGGLEAVINRITKTEDFKTLIELFQEILLMSYGVKSPDGKRFIKNDTLREEFKQTPAYDIMFMELATNDEFASKFVIGIMPKDFMQKIEELEKAGKIQNVMLPEEPPKE